MAAGDISARKDPLVGTVVNGKYRVQAAIAKGGMGRIYYATQAPLDRPVALKVVQADGENEEESQFLKRFLQEASILAKLQHQNVVTLYDYGKIEGAAVEKYFIAMEFLAGETLAHRFKARGRMLAPEALLLTRQIARGLREAHKRGIVHRDLKPSNIILVPEGDGSEIVKLVDFGIGKVLDLPDDAQDLTQDGVFVGTPRYMAPEQFEGTASPASDMYALGTILFQALAGDLPFAGSTMSDFMVAKLARAVPTIRQVTPDVQIPDSIEAFVAHLLARRPEDRPTTDQVHAHLVQCEEDVFGTPHSRSGPYSLRSTGSGPVSASSGPIGPISGVPRSGPRSGPLPPPFETFESSGEDSRVPPTVVAQIPMVQMQMTPRPMASSARPPPPATSSRAPLLLACAALIGIALAAGAWWKLRPRARATTAAASAASNAQEIAPPPIAETTAFWFTIESTPPGATVSEGESVLGETPLSISIERPSVAAGPRTFVVKKDGFAPSRVVQGASNESVKSVVSLAALAPEASATVKSRPPTKGTAGAAGSGTGPGLEIRLKR